jgi:mycoredoxin
MTETRAAVIEVYWRPGCPYCRMLLRPLRRSDLRLREINIWGDPDAAARVRSVANGNETVPTVFIGNRAMVNPSVRQVFAAARGEPPPAPW